MVGTTMLTAGYRSWIEGQLERPVGCEIGRFDSLTANRYGNSDHALMKSYLLQHNGMVERCFTEEQYWHRAMFLLFVLESDGEGTIC